MSVLYSFLLLNSIPLYSCTTFGLSIPQLVGLFPLLAIMNNAFLNTDAYRIFCGSIFVSFGYIPRSRIAGSYGNFLSF